jgi:energy-coupling factor transporter ATP-binding protein EcfA2
MDRIPQLSESFWQSDPALNHIRLSAWESTHNPASPDAVLGVVLCRVAAMIPTTTTLPNGGSLNYLVALVGPSGVGKSTSKRLAQRLIPDIGTELDSVGVGSGEGLIEAYLQTENDPEGKTKRKVQRHSSAFFYVDEAETFIRGTKRDGSTTLGTLRTMWTGADAGVINATKDTTRRLQDGTYRFSCAMGFQPEFAINLISDDAAGTPQRFLFVSARDAFIPDVSVPTSHELRIHPPLVPVAHVDAEITRTIGERRRRELRGQITADPLDSHRDLMQLKTAYLLSVLCGSSDGITSKWWNLAGELVSTSSAIRSKMLDMARQQETLNLAAKVNERIETNAMLDEANIKRISRNLGKQALRLGPNPSEKLINKLAGRDRPYADIEDAIRRGYLVPTDRPNQYRAGPNVEQL